MADRINAAPELTRAPFEGTAISADGPIEWFRITENYQDSPLEVIQFIQSLKNNDVTEALVRGEDGKLYLAYVPAKDHGEGKFPYLPGQTMNFGGFKGEVLNVNYDAQNLGSAAAEGITAGALIGAGFGFAGATGGLSLLLVPVGGYIIWRDFVDPNPGSLRPLRARPNPTAFDRALDPANQ